MNNLNNDSSLQTIINKLPIQIFFNQLPDRKQALNYLEWIYKNVPESKSINEDKLIREVINKELRIVNMKRGNSYSFKLKIEYYYLNVIY